MIDMTSVVERLTVAGFVQYYRSQGRIWYRRNGVRVWVEPEAGRVSAGAWLVINAGQA